VAVFIIVQISALRLTEMSQMNNGCSIWL